MSWETINIAVGYLKINKEFWWIIHYPFNHYAFRYGIILLDKVECLICNLFIGIETLVSNLMIYNWKRLEMLPIQFWSRSRIIGHKVSYKILVVNSKTLLIGKYEIEFVCALNLNWATPSFVINITNIIIILPL